MSNIHDVERQISLGNLLLIGALTPLTALNTRLEFEYQLIAVGLLTMACTIIYYFKKSEGARFFAFAGVPVYAGLRVLDYFVGDDIDYSDISRVSTLVGVLIIWSYISYVNLLVLFRK